MQGEAYWFVMGYAVSKCVYAMELVEYKCVVVLALCGGAGLIWENGEQNSSCNTVLRIGKHVFPHAELHFGEKLGMSILVVLLQSCVGLANDVGAVSATGNVENAA